MIYDFLVLQEDSDDDDDLDDDALSDWNLSKFSLVRYCNQKCTLLYATIK